MRKLNTSLQSVMAIFMVITLFACEGNYREIKQLSTADLGPIAEGKDVNLKYTDSGKLVANLITPRLLDFSNYKFPFSEFPDGLEVQFWNNIGEKTVVTSNYGIHFDKTAIIDLRGDVVLVTSDGNTLYAEQLYWDQQNNWVFTDQAYSILSNDGSFNEGAGFDSSEDFTTFLSRRNVGVQLVDKTKTDE